MIFRFTPFRRAAAAVLCFLLCTAASAEYAAKDSPRITINILSKYLLQLKEKKITSIIFNLPAGAEVENAGGRIKCSHIEIGFSDSFYIVCGGRKLDAPFRLSFIPDTDDAFFSAHIPGEKEPRRYPLNASISGDDRNVSIEITEELSRYAHDSAFSEYGAMPDSASEAPAALSMIIYERGITYLSKHLHGKAAFCDLTHCQTYKGRVRSEKNQYDGIEIDPLSARSGLFFNACCGGTTISSKIFGGSSAPTAAVKDRILQTGVFLCRDAQSKWTREFSFQECIKILSGENFSPESDSNFVYDRDSASVQIIAGTRTFSYPAENFRLKINRVKGWNFIRSNNYEVHLSDGTLFFEGLGLGHGVGFCQQGAAALAKKGFSRYEILEHYYPGIAFIKNRDSEKDPSLQYCTFSLSTGKTVLPYSSFSERRQPAGSLFKICTAAYLLSQHPDMASGYEFRCTGASQDISMPDKCDKPRGHGSVMLSRALSSSCNYYFCSLYNKIDRDDFIAYMKSFCREFGLAIEIPESGYDDQSFARLLAGLDFRTTVRIRDCIALVRIISSASAPNEYSEKGSALFPLSCRAQIFESLHQTFLSGTAFEEKEPDNNSKEERAFTGLIGSDALWGKTSTYIFGTNRIQGYGSFIGACGNTGIISVACHGNGRSAALYSKKILYRINGVSSRDAGKEESIGQRSYRSEP